MRVVQSGSNCFGIAFPELLYRTAHRKEGKEAPPDSAAVGANHSKMADHREDERKEERKAAILAALWRKRVAAALPPLSRPHLFVVLEVAKS